MGFHLVEKVYSNVTGTSPKAQAVLAYLAHRADDRGVHKCFPKRETIAAATHIVVRSVGNALNELSEAKLLVWKSGGRKKGGGGKSLANEYSFNLPDSSATPRGNRLPAAGGNGCPEHEASFALCREQHLPTIKNAQPEHRTSVTETDADSEEARKRLKALGDRWKAAKASSREAVDGRCEVRQGIVEEAMNAAGVDDFENRKIFSTTIVHRDTQQCLDVIFRFASERRAGEHVGLNNPAALLNSRLSALPVVR